MGAGLAVFLAWALSRELDPDYDLSAFVAAALTTAGIFFCGLPDFGGLFWLLLAVRVVNRTTGLPATIFDSIAVLGLGVWLSLRGNGGYAALTAVAFWLDAGLPPAHGRQLAFAVAAALAAAVALAFQGAPALSLGAGAVALGLSALFLPVLAGSGALRNTEDETGEKLKPARVQSGQVLALASGIALALTEGTGGLAAALPLWAAAVGTGGYRLYLAATGMDRPPPL